MSNITTNTTNNNQIIESSVAVYIAKHIATQVNVVVWACSKDEKGKLSLRYYHYWDKLSDYYHTTYLLQNSLGKITSIHVASGIRQKSTKGEDNNNNTKCCEPCMQKLLSFLEGIEFNNNMVNNDGNEAKSAAQPNDNIVIPHINFKAGNKQTDRLLGVVKELLGSDKAAALHYSKDVQIQQNTSISLALVFFLNCHQQWPTVTNDMHITQIGPGVLQTVLHIDPTAAESIHLWPPANAGQQCVTGGTIQNNSIYGMIAQYCQTSSGKLLLKEWLRQPLINMNAILKRQDAVSVLVQDSVGRDCVRNEGLRLFNNIDLAKLAATLSEYDTSSKDEDSNETASKNVRRALMALYNLYLVSSQKLPLLTEKLGNIITTKLSDNNNQDDGMLYECKHILDQCCIELMKSIELVETVLDLNLAPREFLIQSDYKEELNDIKHELDQLQVDIENEHKDMNETWASISGTTNMNSVRLEESDNGYQFRLPDTNHSKILQNELGDIVTVHRLLKNGVYFTTKTLRQLTSKQNDLRAEYDRHQREVVLDAVGVAATYAPILECANEAICTLDVLTALAHNAAYNPHGYCKPIITDSDEDGNAGIDLHGARHPCVELQQDLTDFIPNDCKLIFGQSSFMIVTGPNMGGKSTYIRSIGAIITLAQIGSFVPCTSAKINICHHLLTRVGAGDMQERGISTFMAEMLESSAILRIATKRSLIIIDELGRGTSTFDGYGLARAISEYIVQKIGCLTVFATHFHELTVLEETEKAVVNRHVTAQKGNQGLTFLYEVKPGPCLESFGIQVAEMAKVPKSVIEDAKRRARELENFQYRKKARTEDKQASAATTATEEDEHAFAEKASAAIAFVNRFRRLPKDTFTKPYASEEEKRRIISKLLFEG